MEIVHLLGMQAYVNPIAALYRPRDEATPGQADIEPATLAILNDRECSGMQDQTIQYIG